MANPITPDLVRKLKSVADPSLSPDGSKLAYTLAWVDQQRMETRPPTSASVPGRLWGV